MNFKKLKHLLYPFSSMMVLGLALLSFDPAAEPSQTVGVQIPTPTQAANKDLLSVTPSPKVTQTPTPTPTATPTPTPSLAEINATLDIKAAEDETGLFLTEKITAHLQELYSDPEKNVKNISNIYCYYKEGLSYADYIVYATYEIQYNNSTVIIPQLDAYCVSIDGEAVTVHNEPQDDEVANALFLSRGIGSVRDLYIKETIRRFMNAKLATDETLLSELVTDASRLKIADIQTETQYIESYSDHDFIILNFPETVTEADYLIFVMFNAKLVNIATAAPSMDELIITLDENNYPKVFYGISSPELDAYRDKIKSEELFQNTYNDVINRMADAMLYDPDLLEFIQRINSATGAEQ